MFLAKGSRIYYTDALPAAPYAAAGYLELPAEHGRVSALAACGEDVLCFCERSAFRLSARGGEATFSLSPLSAPLCGGGSSPVAFAGKVYWRSGGRLWSYDGACAPPCSAARDGGRAPRGGRTLSAGGGNGRRRTGRPVPGRGGRSVFLSGRIRPAGGGVRGKRVSAALLFLRRPRRRCGEKGRRALFRGGGRLVERHAAAGAEGRKAPLRGRGRGGAGVLARDRLRLLPHAFFPARGGVGRPPGYGGRNVFLFGKRRRRGAVRADGDIQHERIGGAKWILKYPRRKRKCTRC